MPLSGDPGPDQGKQAGAGHHEKDPTQIEADQSIVFGDRSNQHSVAHLASPLTFQRPDDVARCVLVLDERVKCACVLRPCEQRP